MGRILSNWRIISATLFSVALVLGSYWVARGVGSPSLAEASSETALLQAIATRDSTGDGLPDWEKTLYGIPLNATTTDYFNVGMSDGEAVAKGLIVPKAVANVPTASGADQTPPTLTEAFSQTFFTSYLAAKQANNGVDLSSEQVTTLANDMITQLSATQPLTASFKTAADMTLSGTGDGALRAYAAAAEKVMNAYAAKSPVSELDTLKAALFDNDADALKELAATGDVYKNYGEGFTKIPVPSELLTAHVALVNAFLLRASVTAALARTNTDPLAAMIALQQLDASESEMWKQLSAVATAYANAKTTFRGSEAGASFVSLLSSAKQRAL